MNRKLAIIGVCAAALSVSACSHVLSEGSATSVANLSRREAGEAPKDLGHLVYLAAQSVAERAGSLDKTKPVLVATMVSIDDFNKSSTFGRLTSQLVANRFVQRGYLIREVSYMGALAVAPGTGELVLSRDAARMSRSMDAQAVIAGTYAVGGKEVFLNIRLLRASDGAILSSADVVLPRDANVEEMLNEAAPRLVSYP